MNVHLYDNLVWSYMYVVKNTTDGPTSSVTQCMGWKTLLHVAIV